MATRNWRYFYPAGDQEIQLGNFPGGTYDTRLVRDTCANYAEVRRNVINTAYNFDCWQIALPGPESDEWFHLPSMVVGGRINKPGKLRIYIRTQSSSEIAPNEIECRVTLGHDAKQATLHNCTLGWRLIELILTGDYICNPGARLDIALKTRGVNTIDIWGVSVYQEGGALLYTGNPMWTDLDDANCALGIADYPDSVFAMKLLRDNCMAVRNYKAPKANVWQQHFNCWHKVDIAYGANFNDLGEYRFCKREGVSEVKCHFLAGEQAATGATARLEISDPDGELVNALLPAAAQTIAVNGAALLWYTITWTFQGVDITNERNLALKIDAISPVGYPSEVYIPGVYLVETAPAAAIAHTVPDMVNTPMHSDILASTHDNIRTTLNHLYYQGGKQILIGDWRFAEYVGGNWVLDFLCQHNAWTNSMGNPAFYNNCVVNRALLFSSTSSTKLRSRFEYSTDSTASATKQMQTALSDNLFRTVAQYYEADPFYDAATNNIHQITRVINENERHGLEMCELDIRNADWEEHYDGINEPPNVHMWAIGAATGYIIPHQYSCEECELHPTDFP